MWTNAQLARVKNFPPLKNYLFGYNKKKQQFDVEEIMGVFARYEAKREKQ